MLMVWDNWKATQAYLLGDINRAVKHLKKTKRNCPAGASLARKLTRSLIKRAMQNRARDDLAAAWRDLSLATEIACPTDQDRLSRHKKTLVEWTIESADALLTAGKMSHAITLVSELQSRQILDWRGDRIIKTSQLIQQADRLSALGRFKLSQEKLKQAINLRPDLSLLEARQKANHHRQVQMDRLSRELEQAILGNEPNRIRRLCTELLLVAPNYEVAIDAQRRWKKQENAPIQSWNRSTYEIGHRVERTTRARNLPATNKPFMIWVDQVGGFLACPGNTNTIGAAVSQANIEIPIMADLHRRIARIERNAHHHLIHPLTTLGTVHINGRPVAKPTVWKSGQILELEKQVRILYRQTHPMSDSARLKIISRHRTHPRSDAMLLVAETIVLGPDPRSHIHCPQWPEEMTFFFHDGTWHCECSQPFQVDSKQMEGVARLTQRSRIFGTGFSISLEPVA